MAVKTLPKSPRGFVGDGAIGLAIVAAMSAAAKPIPSPPRSEPIPIVSSLPRDAADAAEEDGDEEMSESYTCVISHVAGSAMRKRVYFDDGSNGVRASPGVFFHSPPPPATPVKLKATEFLNRCYLCTKWLHGIDILIYRGDKAFCSSECRCQQILNDEYTEKCSSGAMKQFKYSVSPCSAPFLFAAGVTAAY